MACQKELLNLAKIKNNPKQSNLEKKTMKKTLLFTAACACGAQVIAEESSKPISAEAELGVITTSGNTETTSMNAKLDVKKDGKHWLHNFILTGLYKEDKITDSETGEDVTQTTAEKYFASLKSDYKLTDDNSALFMFGSYTDDKFSGFDYQATLALGYSDAFYKNDRSHWTYSVGPGYSVYKAEIVNEEDDTITYETTESMIVYLATEFFYQISDTSKFTQTITSDVSSDSEKNTKTKSVSALTSKINGSMALKVSYTIDHNSKVADDKENMDTQTAVTLVITF